MLPSYFRFGSAPEVRATMSDGRQAAQNGHRIQTGIRLAAAIFGRSRALIESLSNIRPRELQDIWKPMMLGASSFKRSTDLILLKQLGFRGRRCEENSYLEAFSRGANIGFKLPCKFAAQRGFPARRRTSALVRWCPELSYPDHRVPPWYLRRVQWRSGA